jgi:hypothetical protein
MTPLSERGAHTACVRDQTLVVLCRSHNAMLTQATTAPHADGSDRYRDQRGVDIATENCGVEITSMMTKNEKRLQEGWTRM